MKLNDYLKLDRGNQVSLAKAINSHAPDISRWASGDRAVPISRCIKIEQATNGKVTRKDLRPDDWMQIWPEFKTQDAA
jgi:DNA-binding transcriptional regulator YdaS (Cro superfamily)